ncbi:DUF6286 domain-containing protein [Streptomyces sp. NPDC058685]|uniref:DUF6286 domain-containing protein n=1 Tax=Streptomyces sp. NPDC058685 TaxID=3346598 RepID=UPI003663D988
MKRRPRRSVPATLTALLVLAICVLAAIIAIQMIMGVAPLISYRSVTDYLAATRWIDTATFIAGGAATLLGLIMLIAAILPGRPTVVPLDGDLDAGASRRSLRRTLLSAARRVDGVSKAKLKLTRRTVAARIRTDRTNTAGLTETVRDTLNQRLDQIAPATRPAVKVKLHATRSTS